ncbi:hypothetical protein [Microbulbifer sp. VAAF005]|uniref:hypothetical protein n=1 Tax=Microbulbifer sp. VAAF005 TaxID=3034230 RepID=UPI0024AE4EB6|nr:hypothetical protein [Microbulbifer sp. VAAF005]WHI46782.1 hypothetical protein P0078_24310 [Microbulbifer sp. VAAF005]
MTEHAVPSIKTPVCTQEQYAVDAGHTLKTVRAQVDRGYLPTIKIGRYRMINLMQLSRMCLEAEPAQPKKK